MWYSYVMGVNDKILSLIEKGFEIEKDNENYMVSFADNSCETWEKFIIDNLQNGYWNEYINKNQAVFIFKINSEIKRFVVDNFKNKQVLKLCRKLCGRRFWSIKSMLRGNYFYARILK